MTVTNTAGPAGAAVVLGFVAGDGKSAPLRKLFDFAKTGVLQPGAKETVTLRSTASSFAVADDGGTRIIRPGAYTLLTGDPSTPAAHTVHLSGPPHAIAGH